MSGWIVHKFGGTSVAGADRYHGVARILNARASAEPRRAVVVSAMSKVTDALIALVDAARLRDDSYTGLLEKVEDQHLKTVATLFEAPAHAAIRDGLETRFTADFKHLREILRGIYLAKNADELVVELVSGHGELWSAQLLEALLTSQGQRARWLDAREVLVVEAADRAMAVAAVVVDWKTSQEKLDAWIRKDDQTVVITGFIASTRSGVATTLKRNGSDYSASIFGRLLSAREILIWTDVDGVLSADPRLVPDAVVLGEMSYEEATELAYFGAKVVHPSTMAPAIARKIPIWIKNTFRPDAPGTCIHEVSRKLGSGTVGQVVRGFSTIDDMALVNVEGTGMIGVPGVAERIFGSLKDVGVSVVMISQASSEQSVCFAVASRQSKLARETIERAFFAEIAQGQIECVHVTDGCSVLAAVGDGMVESPGVAGRFFTALGRARVNVRAIAQGSSERNISAVIDAKDATRALRTVHSAFFLSPQTVSIGLIGPGLIGGTVLAQIAATQERLKRERGIDLRIRGILSTKKMLLSDSGIDPGQWKSEFEKSEQSADLDLFTKHVGADYLPLKVIIEATASGELLPRYPRWLADGISVITPNKRANTGDLEFYRELRSLARKGVAYYLYDTTVGAGLPILHTLRELMETGDRVRTIEGVLSGTLSYLFNSFGGDRTFSACVLDAKAKGYTEPDPRDDLSGMDVARKLVILAREMGLSIGLGDVQVESLIPEPLRRVAPEAFLKGLAEFDGAMAAKAKAAAAKGQVLRYIGRIDARGTLAQASVSLQSIPVTHAFARITGSDNIIAFETDRYQNQPLVVQGPGAGPEVTAGGVFANLLRIATYFGAPA